MPVASTDDLRPCLVGRFDILDDNPHADRIRQVGIEAAGFIRHSWIVRASRSEPERQSPSKTTRAGVWLPGLAAASVGRGGTPSGPAQRVQHEGAHPALVIRARERVQVHVCRTGHDPQRPVLAQRRERADRPFGGRRVPGGARHAQAGEVQVAKAQTPNPTVCFSRSVRT